jgi:hypothetical protein
MNHLSVPLAIVVSLIMIHFVIIPMLLSWRNHASHFLQPVHQESKAEMIPEVLTELITQHSRQSAACAAPGAVDPNNYMIRKYGMNKKKAVKCPIEKPATMINHKTGIVTAARGYRCYYSFITMKNNSEEILVYSHPKRLRAGTRIQLTMELNTVNTTCYLRKKNANSKDKSDPLINTHVWIPKFNTTTSQSSAIRKPSIVILMIESLSQLLFQRCMKQTVKSFLKLPGHVYTFKHFVKQGESSFVNDLALLAGLVTTPLESLTIAKGRGQTFDLLSDVFRDHGYVTANEDNHNIFDHFRWHLSSPPTDFYPHQFWRQMYPDDGTFDSETVLSIGSRKDYCFAKNGPKFSILMQHIATFVENNVDLPYFYFMKANQFTHEDQNDMPLIDPYLADMFDVLRERQLLQNTIFILCGDHGQRRAMSQYNVFGRMEDNMPLFTMFVPNYLMQGHSLVHQIMTANINSLLTWTDANQMLENIAKHGMKLGSGIIPHIPERVDFMKQLVPRSRTCADALIPPSYCVCNNQIHSRNNSRDARKALNSLKQHLKEINRHHLCPRFAYIDVIDFYYILPKSGDIEQSVLKVHAVPIDRTFNVCLQRNLSRSEKRYQVVEEDDVENGCTSSAKMQEFMCVTRV